jgi:CRP/FNR family nitrogen fixation transcriptional regulator
MSVALTALPHHSAVGAQPRRAAAAPARTDRHTKLEHLDFPHSIATFATDQQIYSDGDEAKFFYAIVSGTVRTCKFLIDGRRQVEAFHCHGDVFGIEGGSEHLFSAEAVSDCVVAAYRRHNVASVALHDAGLSRLLFSFAARSMLRAQEHALLLGTKSALERVAIFLINWAAQGEDKTVAELTMARHDIADYLGLTIETVSRTFTILEQRQLIAMRSPRQIMLTGLTADLSFAA